MTRHSARIFFLPRHITSRFCGFHSIFIKLSPPKIQHAGITRSVTTGVPSQPSVKLTWPEYLALRKRQRQYALLATIPITTLGLSLGINYFATIEALPTDLIMGIEAPYVYGLATLGCGLVGYLIGPSIGHAFFRLQVNKPIQRAMQDKNAIFYSHIKKYRVDPAQSIVNNPLPDWHGERIGSLKDYRKWLRDQSAYKQKATQHNMLLSPEDLNKGKDML